MEKNPKKIHNALNTSPNQRLSKSSGGMFSTKSTVYDYLYPGALAFYLTTTMSTKTTLLPFIFFQLIQYIAYLYIYICICMLRESLQNKRFYGYEQVVDLPYQFLKSRKVGRFFLVFKLGFQKIKEDLILKMKDEKFYVELFSK